MLKLLVQTAPAGPTRRFADPVTLHGPVVNPAGRADVVANQEQVDDLLVSLGF